MLKLGKKRNEIQQNMVLCCKITKGSWVKMELKKILMDLTFIIIGLGLMFGLIINKIIVVNYFGFLMIVYILYCGEKLF